MLIIHTHTYYGVFSAGQDVLVGFCPKVMASTLLKLSVGLSFVILFLGALNAHSGEAVYLHLLSYIFMRAGSAHVEGSDLIGLWTERFLSDRWKRRRSPAACGITDPARAAFPLFECVCVKLEKLSSEIIREIMEYQFAARVGPLTDLYANRQREKRMIFLCVYMQRH